MSLSNQCQHSQSKAFLAVSLTVSLAVSDSASISPPDSLRAISALTKQVLC